jgi:hypothetical protein
MSDNILCEKLDSYLWPDQPITRYQRSRQHVETGFVNDRILFAYRSIVFALLWI